MSFEFLQVFQQPHLSPSKQKFTPLMYHMSFPHNIQSNVQLSVLIPGYGTIFNCYLLYVLSLLKLYTKFLFSAKYFYFFLTGSSLFLPTCKLSLPFLFFTHYIEVYASDSVDMFLSPISSEFFCNCVHFLLLHFGIYPRSVWHFDCLTCQSKSEQFFSTLSFSYPLPLSPRYSSHQTS